MTQFLRKIGATSRLKVGVSAAATRSVAVRHRVVTIKFRYILVTFTRTFPETTRLTYPTRILNDLYLFMLFGILSEASDPSSENMA